MCVFGCLCVCQRVLCAYVHVSAICVLMCDVCLSACLGAYVCVNACLCVYFYVSAC